MPIRRLSIVIGALAVSLALSTIVFAAPPCPPYCPPPFTPLPPPTTPAPPPPTPVPPYVPPPAPPTYPTYHTVQWGETLSGIAWRYGVSMWEIARANGIWNVNRIQAGQVLLIPYPGVWPAVPPSYPPFWYTVQRGDTLSSIAWRFGRSIWAIAQANGIWNVNFIYVGQRLWIP
ncbi:MAG: LysM peptidoglycan-binding domain-containing protein [Chloroflexi bacterium]|nr:LysM peptidoglycan-binding domain-containing protein [Chloroflexota bacterium]